MARDDPFFFPQQPSLPVDGKTGTLITSESPRSEESEELCQRGTSAGFSLATEPGADVRCRSIDPPDVAYLS